MITTMKTLTRYAILISILICSCGASADSLYSTDSSGSSAGTARPAINYFADAKAHAVGDILTVVIAETATGSSTATTNQTKTDSAAYGPGFGPFLHLIKNLGLSGNLSSAANAGTTRADNLSATIAVTVKTVLPNGNMVVEGSRTIGTNAEAQTITLSGVVRPADISPLNSVQSPQVADALIKYSGKGPVSEIQHDGLISRIFRYLF